MKRTHVALVASLVVFSTPVMAIDDRRENVVQEAVYSQTEAVVPPVLHRKLIECQYDYIESQYAPNVSPYALNHALEGLVTFHHFGETFEAGNPMDYRDYVIVSEKCAEQYSDEIQSLSY